jgi:hypothetical protein
MRRVPPALDTAIRQRARREGKSLNEVALSALAAGLGVDGTRLVKRDMSDIVGTWRRDAATEAALAAQDRVDHGLWK